MFYMQTVGDQKVPAIQKQLASLNLQEVLVIGAFNPKKGDIVLAQFSAHNSWNRSMLRNLLWATSKHDVYLMQNCSVMHWLSLLQRGKDTQCCWASLPTLVTTIFSFWLIQLAMVLISGIVYLEFLHGLFHLC